MKVAVDLGYMSHIDSEFTHYRHPQRAIVAAIAMSHLKVRFFRLDSYTFYDGDDLLEYDRANLMDCMSTLKDFELVDEILDTAGSQLCVNILGSALRLSFLAFEQGIQSDRSCQLILLPPELLLANRLSSLTHLHIANAVIHADTLIEALERCQKSLVCLHMHYVALSKDDGDWGRVLRTMLAMPELVDVRLLLVQAASVEPRRFFDLPSSFTWPESREFKGREGVAEGLQSLLDNHIYL